ncbi:MAG: hypothetical protein OEW58_11130 [Gammaproteobacteria bacterium]|nr:hypothetical protein [Gammaproteobacteria bacterium]
MKFFANCIFSVAAALMLNPAYAYERKFELSFGTSQMLVDEVDRVDVKNSKKIILPTTGALLISEYLWSERWGTMLAANLPLETQKFLVNNELVEESASATCLLGQRYTPFNWQITEKASMSPQIGVFVAAMVGEKLELSPTVAGRIHINDDSGFTMYVGSSASYGIKGYVLFYGIGHRF